jgi:hypothetical protein
LPSGPLLWTLIVPSLAGASFLGPVTAKQFIARNEHPIESQTQPPLTQVGGESGPGPA